MQLTANAQFQCEYATIYCQIHTCPKPVFSAHEPGQERLPHRAPLLHCLYLELYSPDL